MGLGEVEAPRMSAPLCGSCRYFLRYTQSEGIGEATLATDHTLCVLTRKNEWVIRCNWHQERMPLQQVPLARIELTI
mgnify:CR=1 FL=1